MTRPLRWLLPVGTGAMAWGAFAVAQGAPENAASAIHGPEAARRSAALATFSGGSITVGDVEDVIRAKPARVRAELAQVEPRTRLLDTLVSYDLLVLEAARRGYREHPLVIEAGKRAAIERWTEAELKVSPASIPAEAVASVHETEQPQLSRPAWRRASQIEVASADEAKQLIAELAGVDRLRFAEAAGKRSRDQKSARQGGELGFFDSEGKRDHGESAGIAPEIVAATFALEVGAITPEPIAHDGVFSIVMLTGEMAAFSKPLAKMGPHIRERLAAERSAQALEAKVQALREQFKPEVHPDLLDAITLEPAQSTGIPEGFPAAPRDPRAAVQEAKPDGY